MNISVSGDGRERAFDHMRVLAAFAVIVIHVSAMQWRTLDIHSLDWNIITFWDGISKFSVPLFFMVSGRFCLDAQHKMDLKTVLTKRLPRLAIAFLVWSCVYTVLNLLRVDSIQENWKWIVVEFFSGEYHMWFLFAIAGLYLISPLLKLLAEGKKMCQYFLVLFIVFQLVLPALSQLPMIGVFLSTILNEMQLRYPLGYSGYYLLGYYLKKHTPGKCVRAGCYALGIVGAVYSAVATILLSRSGSVANESLAEYLTWNVAAEAVAIYLAVLQTKSGPARLKKVERVVSILAKYSLGIYLAHPLFLWIFEWVGLEPNLFCPVISVPMIAALAMALSLLLSVLLRRIPRIGKYIS